MLQVSTRASYDIEKPFSSCSPIANCVCCDGRSTKAKPNAENRDSLQDPPVLTIPPIVAPGLGSSHVGSINTSEGKPPLTPVGKKREIPAHRVLVGDIVNATRAGLSLSAPHLHPSTELLLDRPDPNPPLAGILSPYNCRCIQTPYREPRESCPSRTHLCISHRPGTANNSQASSSHTEPRAIEFYIRFCSFFPSRLDPPSKA